MFDMGFTEMMLIGIVALIVIGPERLPGVARTAGKYVGRLKRFMTSVKADVEQELRADELRQILSQQQKELDSLKDSISEAGHDISKHANLDDSVGASSGKVDGDAQSKESIESEPPATSTRAEESPTPVASGEESPETVPTNSEEPVSKVNS